MALKHATTLVTAPADQPVTVPDVKRHLRIPDFEAGHDVWITRTIAAATDWFHNTTGRQLVSATRDHFLDCFPAGRRPLELPYSPVASITSISYTDTDGGADTFTDFSLLSGHEPGVIVPTFSNTWPATRYIEQAVTVRFVCGYGDLLDVPSAVKAGLLMLIGHWFNNREEGSTLHVREIPLGAKNIAEQYRVGDEFTEYA